MQIVILAGGEGSRVEPLYPGLAKSMIPFEGRPFLEHQLALLRGHGITDIILCVGHRADQIESHFGDGRRFGVEIQYSPDGGAPLGTGGALKKAATLLDPVFLLMYGDSYLVIDYENVIETFLRARSLSMMVVLENRNRWVPSNVAVRDGYIHGYAKGARPDESGNEMIYVDYGLSIFRQEALAWIPEGRRVSLDPLFERLIEAGEMKAYLHPDRFYEIGSPRGIEDFSAWLAGRKGGLGR